MIISRIQVVAKTVQSESRSVCFCAGNVPSENVTGQIRSAYFVAADVLNEKRKCDRIVGI